MPAIAASRTPRLDLPPPYTLVTLREAGDAFAHACRIAPEAGAGTLVVVGRFDLVEFAVVLEPEEPLRSARRAFVAGMAALADAVAVHCPPDMALEVRWPDTLRFNGAVIGRGRLGWPADGTEDSVPDWLVFGAVLVAARLGGGDPGLRPELSSLAEEGFAVDGRALVESFSRHLMSAFHAWADEGFEVLAERYLERLPKKAGSRYALADNGDLLVRHHAQGAPERQSLMLALRDPSWIDSVFGRPKP